LAERAASAKFIDDSIPDVVEPAVLAEQHFPIRQQQIALSQQGKEPHQVAAKPEMRVEISNKRHRITQNVAGAFERREGFLRFPNWVVRVTPRSARKYERQEEQPDKSNAKGTPGSRLQLGE
jgi:hypothetical protein